MLSDIAKLQPINEVDQDKVADLAKSMRDGWSGPAILFCGDHAITGSHRIAAAELLVEAGIDYVVDAVDVSDIVGDWCEENQTTVDDFPFDNLSAVFAGTWAEDIASQNSEY